MNGTESNNYEIKDNKKIYPVYNENNNYLEISDIEAIYKKAGIKIAPKCLKLYQTAFNHKSYDKNSDFSKNEKYFGNINALQENNQNIMPLHEESSEVLEWLGDGILQAISAIYLYKRYSDNQKEGFLTKLRSKLVKTETLAKLALVLGLDKHLIISKHVEVICQGRNNSRILEDCFEAFLGAMMEDIGKDKYEYGFKIIYEFITNLIEKFIDISSLIQKDDNYKDQLMRYFQKEFNGKCPEYEQISEKNETNAKGITYREFTMCIRNNNKIIGEGCAKSKKEAEQKAAQNALRHFGIFNGY